MEVSVKCGVGVGVGVGIGISFACIFLFLSLSFFLCLFFFFFFFFFLNPNSDFSQFALAVHHFYIFESKRNEKRSMEVQVDHRKQTRCHIYIHTNIIFIPTRYFQTR